MNILKQAFEFLNKPAQKKYNKKAQAYLDKFKKTYDERTASEKILTECLYKIEVAQVMGAGLARFLGAMEATLVIEGHLEYGKSFDYLTLKGLFGDYKENYTQFIVRKSKEYLTIKEVL